MVFRRDQCTHDLVEPVSYYQDSHIFRSERMLWNQLMCTGLNINARAENQQHSSVICDDLDLKTRGIIK